MNYECKKIIVIQEPTSAQLPEGMSAASVIAMAADIWNLPLPSAFRSPSVVDQLQQQMEKTREDGVKMIRVTSALDPSERLIDPG